MTISSQPAVKEEIARVAYAIWEAEGHPEGRDHEHWARAKRLVEEGRAQVEFPEGEADGGRTATRPDARSQDSAQTPSEKPGPRNPSPLPAANHEGYVAIPSGEDAAANAVSADPSPPDTAAPTPKTRKKPAGRKPVEPGLNGSA